MSQLLRQLQALHKGESEPTAHPPAGRPLSVMAPEVLHYFEEWVGSALEARLWDPRTAEDLLLPGTACCVAKHLSAVQLAPLRCVQLLELKSGEDSAEEAAEVRP